MSITHEIHTEKYLDIDNVISTLSRADNTLQVQNQGKGIYHFYSNGKSTRGVDLSKEDYGYEIRNTVLSAAADFEIANQLGKIVCLQTEGKVYTEEEEEADPNMLFSSNDIQRIREQEASVVLALLNDGKPISFYGPVRQFHFGERLAQTLSQYKNNPAKLADEMERIALNVQYKYPDYGTNNILRTTKNEEEIFVKVISHSSHYVLGKYEYLILSHEKQEEEGLLMLTNNDLIGILPHQWELLDEYTIHAPALEEQCWKQLLEAARPLNCFNKFNENE